MLNGFSVRHLAEAWEKRDWRGPKPAWRRIQALMVRYPRGTKGPSVFAVRIINRKRAKRLITGGDGLRPY